MKAHERLKEVFKNRNPISIASEISGFTGFRTTKIDELSEEEAIHLLIIYQAQAQTSLEDENMLDRMLKKEYISKILNKAEQLGIKEPNAWEKFNRWMYFSSKHKKHLNAHSLPELKALHRQLFAYEQNQNKSAQKAFTKAWWQKNQRLKNYN